MADNFVALLEQRKPEILNVLPEYVNKDRWWAFMYELSRNKDLQRVAQNNPNSIINALKQLADWGLIPDGREALIVAYGDTAQAQSMYLGDIKRVKAAGIAVHIYAELVREGDAFEATSGSTRDIKHVPVPFSTKPVIGCYAVAVLPNGLIDYEMLNLQDMQAIANAGQRNAARRGSSNTQSPARQAFPGEMDKKGAIRRLCKRLVGAAQSEEGDRYDRMVKTENNGFSEPINVTSVANHLDNPEPQTDPRIVEPEITVNDPPIGKDSSDYADIQTIARIAKVPWNEVESFCEAEFNCAGPEDLPLSQMGEFIRRVQGGLKGKAA